MTVIRDVAGRWSCKAPRWRAPLERGLRFVVEPGVLDRKTETVCRLLEWQYRVERRAGDAERASDAGVELELELIVEEIRPGRFERWFAGLSNDTQFWAPVTTALLVLAIGAGFLYTLYVQPTHGLVFAGKHVQSFGVIAIVLLFVFVLPWKLGLFKGPTRFRKPFFSALLITSAWVLCALWLAFSHPSQPLESDEQYVAYAKALGRSMSRSYWPILVAALPWLSVSFKIFGLDRAEKASEGLEKLSKK
jgi:hypothetical protein